MRSIGNLSFLQMIDSEYFESIKIILFDFFVLNRI